MDAIHPTTRRSHAKLRDTTTTAQYNAFMARIAGTSGASWRISDDGERDLLCVCYGKRFTVRLDGSVIELSA